MKRAGFETGWCCLSSPCVVIRFPGWSHQGAPRGSCCHDGAGSCLWVAWDSRLWTQRAAAHPWKHAEVLSGSWHLCWERLGLWGDKATECELVMLLFLYPPLSECKRHFSYHISNTAHNNPCPTKYLNGTLFVFSGNSRLQNPGSVIHLLVPLFLTTCHIYNPLASSQNHSWLRTAIHKHQRIHRAAGKAAVGNIWKCETPTCQCPSMMCCFSRELT